MIKTTEQKFVFCCARGEYRGPELSEKVPGSEYVEGGYTGIANWLATKSKEEQVEELELFYAGSFLVLIADEADKKYPPYACALHKVLKMLASTTIRHNTFEHQDLLRQIADNITYIY